MYVLLTSVLCVLWSSAAAEAQQLQEPRVDMRLGEVTRVAQGVGKHPGSRAGSSRKLKPPILQKEK
jgi:hypothetical protein